MPVCVRYHFRQPFKIPARQAYAWCTSFEPDDHTLLGIKNAQRKITRLTDQTIILNDSFQAPNGYIKKQKLVQLYPDCLTWTATHITGPNKYSQFLYKISADDENVSHLDFTANHLEYENEGPAKKEVALLAEKLCREDAEMWRLFAAAMEKDLGK
jgi:hypothetical protein